MRTGRISLADVLVLAAVVLLALPVLAMSMRGTRDVGNYVTCSSNLRQIGLAIQSYAADNRGAFPRTNWRPLVDPNPVPTAYTGLNAANSFAADGPADNDVTAALFLTLKTQGLTPEDFICPTDTRATPFLGKPATTSNWPGRQNLSYSYNNPYSSLAARNAGLRLNFTLGSDYALAADMNPGGVVLTQLTPDAPPRQMRAGNSPIHRGEGQCVLYADGHVEFQTSPFCGAVRPASGGGTVRDNIYTAGAPNSASVVGPTPLVLAAPQDQFDSVLLPAAPEGPLPVLPTSVPIGLWVGIGAAGVTIVAATTVLVRRRRRRLSPLNSET